jgi:menaquinone-9 beta-reductase
MIQYFRKQITIEQMSQEYHRLWRKNFARRLWVGRNVQAYFGNEKLTEALISTTQWLPFLRSWLVRYSHGKVF